eukprot:11796042-Alexandrium_andersonii.AAC.1
MSGRTQGEYVPHRASQASEADREQPPVVLGPPPPTPVGEAEARRRLTPVHRGLNEVFDLSMSPRPQHPPAWGAE